MKKLRLLGLLIILVTMSFLSGCGKKEEVPEKTAQTSSMVTVGDTSIIVGATLLKELQEQGYMIAEDKNLTKPLKDTKKMPGRTYDVGVYFGKDEKVYGLVECLNDKEVSIPYMESIINNITVYYTENPDPYSMKYYYDTVLIDGVDFKGMTSEQVSENLKDVSGLSDIKYPDGSVAYLTFDRNNCYFQIKFDMESHLATEINVEMFHSEF